MGKVAPSTQRREAVHGYLSDLGEAESGAEALRELVRRAGP